MKLADRPKFYYRDGKPILSTELMPDFLQWATLFEAEDRVVKSTRTLYGEKISTVWLGMDHCFGDGPPLIFETMLFAPRKYRAAIFFSDEEKDGAAAEAEKIKRDYPHDNAMLRYTTEAQARNGHRRMQLCCLVPPRWRKFVFYTLGRDATWS